MKRFIIFSVAIYIFIVTVSITAFMYFCPYDTTMMILLGLMLAVIGLMLVIFNMFIARYLRSLKSTMDSMEAALRAKSEFLTTVSHEIRTPLNAIIGIAQIHLQSSSLPQKYAVDMEQIYSSGTSLLGIINDILDMSHIESGKLELHPAEYDLPSLINDALQLCIVRTGSKPVETILDIDETLPLRLYGDVLRLKQILNTLLSNGVKYTEKGYVKLSVSHRSKGGETTLCFTVEDTGRGLQGETARGSSGLGLSLSIVRQLVEMMDGTIEAYSEEGKGSTFVVCLQQKSMYSEAIGPELAEKLSGFTFCGKRQAVDKEIKRVPMPHGRVLIVDDMLTNLHVTGGLLAQYKLAIETADSGFGALDKIAAGKEYDIIFMDQMMPQMDGLETTRKLRERGYTGTIVALTANALAGNEELFTHRGFDDFMSKPMDARKLDEVLHKYIAPPESGSPEPAAIDITPPVDEQLLRLFCRDAEKTITTLRETATGDLKLFTTAAHALKPVLATLGEQEAYNQAFALEKAGKSGDKAFIAEHTEGFIGILEILIEKYKPAETVNADVDEDIPYLAEQLRQVAAACGDYDDTAAYGALDKLKEKPWNSKTAVVLEEIHDMLFLHSDFEGAGEKAGALLDSLAESL